MLLFRFSRLSPLMLMCSAEERKHFFQSAYRLYDVDFYVKADHGIHLSQIAYGRYWQKSELYMGCMNRAPVSADPMLNREGLIHVLFHDIDTTALSSYHGYQGILPEILDELSAAITEESMAFHFRLKEEKKEKRGEDCWKEK
ncbi:putative beta-1-3-galactosyltransferase 14 [Nymphaea thermarum]|nr:putative beta-1-3-galactosyltransferase 14 [Nymphaea thermarum]